MQFKLEISLDNEAFQYGPEALAESLESVSEQIRNGYEAPEKNNVQDSNGNTVGYWSIIEEK